MSSENVEIGARLKELRNKTGLNQQEFAETIGVSYRSYRAYESGQREVTTAVLTKLYDLMGHSPMWVLTGKRTSLNETDMRVVRQAILAGLQTLSTEALNNSKEKASEFLQLVVKLSLQQGACLSLEDTKAISRQDFE